MNGCRPFLTDFGKDAQYGQNLFNTLGYPEFEGPTHNNTCQHGPKVREASAPLKQAPSRQMV